jgi:hypothetical protein
VILGHSIANGVGADDTVYGGAAVPGGITLRNNGTTTATYPDNAGTGSDPGVVPYWAAHMVSGTIIRRATNGQILSGIEVTELPGAISDCIALGVSRDNVDAVILMIGENDSQDAIESAAYAARIAQTADMVERAFPNARVIIQNQASENVSYSEFAAIRTANAAAVALRSTRGLAAYADITFNDAVHYDLAGYATAAAAQIAAYAGTS